MDPTPLADTASASNSLSPPGAPPSQTGSLESENGRSSVAHRPRHTRTSTPKAKPHCMNCLKTRGICDGYAVKPRKTRGKVPRNQERLNPEPPCRRSSPRLRIREPNMNTLDFEDDMQSVYFDDWNELVRVSLGGAHFSRSNLWTTTMPQLTRRNSALRQAAMSIGAISRALSSHGSSYVLARNFDGIANLLKSPHYQNAIVYYCQALRLQGQADFQTASIQEAVLLSILFVAFEALRGNRHSALQHVKFGFVLLQELLTSDDSDHRIWNLAPDPRQLITEILDLYNHLDVQSRTVLSGHVKSSRSPAYQLIKGLKARGHTIETYNMQIQRYTDPGEGRKAMPEVFNDAGDAYFWWQTCQRRIAKLGPLLLTVIDDFKIEEINDEAGIDQLLEMMQKQPELLAYCEKSVANLQQWRHAFEPLYNKTLSDTKIARKEYLKILHLRMHYLVMFLYSFFPKYADEATIASMTPYCREINDVVEILLREQQQDFKSPAHVFSMEFGLAWQLTVVAMTCRDPLVRDNSTRILEAYPRKEGLWDSKAFLAVLKKNRELEAENAKEGTLAEQWRRLCRREFIFEDAGDTIIFRSLKKREDNGEWELVEETAEFKGEVDGLDWKRRPTLEGKFRTSTSKIRCAREGRAEYKDFKPGEVIDLRDEVTYPVLGKGLMLIAGAELCKAGAAGGNIGKAIVKELLKTAKQTVAAIKRTDSSNTLPDDLHKAFINYEDEKFIVAALKVITENIADGQKAGLTLITLMNGFWYEYSLEAGPNIFEVDLKNRTVTRVTGISDGDRKTEFEILGERYTDSLEELRQGKEESFYKMMYVLVFQPTDDADFKSDNELLKLPVEDLNEAMWMTLLKYVDSILNP
ncbi:C6 zinc finger domain-containing protein [Colletotrichum orchidophilum]|uniref:C6 zinc finger domain-containing protein n=1 Tax=Colletotrichum orchidophilum TaxID=1209926 RepID=A0A1G4BD34_9PEZI|nr:C6 zinc finger domain-containing protein [Colletotrichum orchidophilum]OHE99318.1 C6 zinc finger domain-containing protein [Colletotrichum orchidophilum]